MTIFVLSPKEAATRTKLDCKRKNGGRALSTESKTSEGQNLFQVRDSSKQVDFVLYGLMVTARDRNALRVVENELNMFARC